MKKAFVLRHVLVLLMLVAVLFFMGNTIGFHYGE
jgi:hypothetical protein